MVVPGITRHRIGTRYFDRIELSELITPPRSNITMICPAGCGSDAQSGTYGDRSGEIQLTANDTVYMFLSGFLPYLYGGGKIKIERITIFYRTTALNTDYITNVAIESHDPTDGTYTTEWADPTDVGIGETGRNSVAYNPNYVFEANKSQCLQIAVVASNVVYIYAMKLEWRMVPSTTEDGSVG